MIKISNTDWLEWQKKVVYEEYIKPYLDKDYVEYEEKKDVTENDNYVKQTNEK